jgi:hypothetical protein
MPANIPSQANSLSFSAAKKILIKSVKKFQKSCIASNIKSRDRKTEWQK